MKTGFIGLGAMGESMARNLYQAGLLAGVWNRTRQKAESLAAETGCLAADDPADLVRACEAVVLCVSADRDVSQMVEALLPGLRPDVLVIDCSTVSAETARQAAAEIAAAGGHFLDAPISGGTEGAKQGSLTIMVGGEAAAFERAQPALKAMGERIVHMGPVGAGQATKAVNQVMCAGINQAVCESLAFAKALELPLDKVIDVVGSGAAGNWFVNHRGLTMVRGEYPPGFKLVLHQKDLEICQVMAQRAGGSLPLTTATIADYADLITDEHGEEDISALFRLKRELF